jgi:T6SS, Phospholipase effector Tle1-like, catalytic domain
MSPHPKPITNGRDSFIPTLKNNWVAVNWFTLAPNSQRLLFAHSMLPLGGRSGNVPKNLVLCCDGTANEFAQDRTNVVKLFFTLARDPHRQVNYSRREHCQREAARLRPNGSRFCTNATDEPLVWSVISQMYPGV